MVALTTDWQQRLFRAAYSYYMSSCGNFYIFTAEFCPKIYQFFCSKKL
ncbi:hypothetical protein FDUTEX481_03483 [Tolypothrix sp. PCC 7601]|nr:hypothetical protein FDUTEX481_03483 [Tolypothrix sp. PCC 7601]